MWLIFDTWPETGMVNLSLSSWCEVCCAVISISLSRPTPEPGGGVSLAWPYVPMPCAGSYLVLSPGVLACMSSDHLDYRLPWYRLLTEGNMRSSPAGWHVDRCTTGIDPAHSLTHTHSLNTNMCGSVGLYTYGPSINLVSRDGIRPGRNSTGFAHGWVSLNVLDIRLMMVYNGISEDFLAAPKKLSRRRRLSSWVSVPPCLRPSVSPGRGVPQHTARWHQCALWGGRQNNNLMRRDS